MTNAVNVYKRICFTATTHYTYYHTNIRAFVAVIIIIISITFTIVEALAIVPKLE